MKYIYIALIIALPISGWVTHGWYTDSLDLAIERTARASQVAAAKEIAKIEVMNTTINNRFKDVIKTELVYTKCVHVPMACVDLKEVFK